MKLVVIVLVIAAVIGLLLVYRTRRGTTAAPGGRVERPAPPSLPTPEPLRRVGHMIHPGETGCAAAAKIATAWFPGEVPPALPLDSCEHPESCKCRWTRVLDRRQTLRRSGLDRRDKIRFEDKPDRRSSVDRRQESRDIWKQRP